MQSVIGVTLRSLAGLMLFLYILFPRETGQWVAVNLHTRADSFCEHASASASRFQLNRGQCSTGGQASAGHGLESLWSDIHALLAQRAQR